MASITFTIPDEKLTAFKLGFFKCRPVPDGMTEGQWIREWGKQQYFKAYKVGMEEIAREEAVIDSGIVE
ncbi:MAG: hypothetical protein ACYS6W_17745 [Planctomycetota bacterium]|jgi:hypothetical protein